MIPELFGYLGTASILLGEGFLAHRKFRVGWPLMTLGAIWWMLRGVFSGSMDLMITNVIFILLNSWYTIKNWGRG